ncbi:MAG: ABC-2 family transporter protein [bacterium]|nr:ABC-2 family transporter protein [bacterium]
MFSKKVRKYWEVFWINLRTEHVYLINMLARVTFIGFRIWILAQLYEASFKSQYLSEVEGFTVSTVVWMVALTQSFGILTSPDMAKLISEEVKRGDVTYSLLRPGSYILLQYFTFWGRSLMPLFWSICTGALAAWLLVGTAPISFESFCAGALLLFLGGTLHAIIQLILGLLAFWLEEVSAFRWIYQKLYIALGGMILPPAIFPDWMRTVVERLPFAQLFYSASEITVRFSSEKFLQFISIQLFWLCCTSLVLVCMFRSSVKRISLNGG